MSHPASDSRRRFLGGLGSLSLGAALPLASSFGLAGCRSRGAVVGTGRYGPLRPVACENTGLNLLRLPEGFRYRSFGWAGEALADGSLSPSAHDGMGVVAARDGVISLIRNHEIITSPGAFGPAAVRQDALAGGGCVAFEFDTRTEQASGFRAVLSGTLQNCAGGVTPRGSWLSCEEMGLDGVSKLDDRGAIRSELSMAHGFVYECYPDGRSPQRIPGMGLFKHEAAATDPATGIVYLTEDARADSGFYRYLPDHRDELWRGGRLQMLRVRGRQDLRRGLQVGQRFDIDWVDIAEPEKAIASPGGKDAVGAAVAEQGHALGGARFLRLEGCYLRAGSVFFTATSGGDLGRGQVFIYRPEDEQLILLYEVKDPAVLDYPDNLCVSPQGVLFINEDNDSGNPQRIVCMSESGEVSQFAESQIVLQGEKGFSGDFRFEEWCGVCFSPDGRWLFSNAYTPGFTVAITGPW